MSVVCIPPNLGDRLSNVQGSLYRGLSLIRFSVIKTWCFRS